MSEDDAESQPGPGVVRLTVPAEPAALDVAQDALARLWERTGLEPGLALRFETGLVEITANVIEHSFDPDHPGRAFTLAVEVADDAVRAELSDNGQPATIDLSAVALPEDDAESGRGLAIAQATLDELTYEHTGGLNVWRLSCRRPPG